MAAARLMQADPLRGRLPGLAARAAVLLAALACLWMLVQLAWALFTPLTPDLPAAASATAPVAPPRATGDIARWHLFGNGNAEALRKDIMEAGQAARLKLVLHGTVSGGADREGYALIADADGVERSYRVGDTIEDGVTLKAVRADHVVLGHDGRNERLDLPRDSLSAAPGVQPLDRAANAHGQPGRPSAGGDGAGTPIFVAPRIASGRVDWQRVQSQIRQDPASVMSSLHLQPVFDGTDLKGVRVGAGAGNPLVASAGLKADDVVTAVNGIQLDSIARGQQLFSQLRNARHVQLTILRNGRSQTLSVDLPDTR